MKRRSIKTIFLSILVLCMMFSNNQYAAKKRTLGDINLDNKVDARDQLLIMRHIMASARNTHPEWILTGDNLKIADVTQNGKVDNSDMLKILRYIASERNPEKIGNKHKEWLEIGEIDLEPDIEVSSIKLNKSTLALDMSGTKTATLIATIEPNNATNKRITYGTSNESVAIVDQKGKITAKGNGTATITATTENGKTAKCAVTVTTSPTGINISKTQATLFGGNATVGRTKIVEATIKPSDATNKEVKWESSDKSVATVEKATIKGEYYISTKVNGKVLSVEGNKTSNGAKIQVKGNKKIDSQKYELIDAGYEHYIIRVKSTGKVLDVQSNQKDNSTQVIQYDLNGNTNQLWKLEDAGNGYYYIKSRSSEKYLDIQGGKANEGDKLIIYDGNKKDNQKFKLEPTGEKVRSESGLVKLTVKKNGTATITAKSNNGKKATCKVTAKTLVTSVKLNKTTIDLDINNNKTATLKATINPSTASDKTLTWSSSNTKIATVNQKGKITAKKDGTATITVKSNNGNKATCIVKVISCGYWENKNGKYIYHYLDGTKRTWTISEYISWKKLKEQKVKAQDPKAYNRTGTFVYYMGFRQYCGPFNGNEANNIAIKNGVSPYAITVDIGRKHESIFENHNGLWEPINSTRVRVGGPFKNYSTADKKMHPTNCLTPVGLYYTNGGRYPKAGITNYWVPFGVKGRGGEEQTDYLHGSSYPRSVRNWGLCSSTR